MSTFAPTAIRASELARCARMAAGRGLGWEQQEHDDLTRRYFARGHLYTDYVCRQLEAKYGKDDVEREREIHWPLGTGHADAYIRSLKLAVEVKSTAMPTTASPGFDMAVWQTKIYIHFDPEAESGALYMINPSDLGAENVFDIRLSDDDTEQIDAWVEAARAALDGGPLPDRVCKKPGQARGRLCPFAEPCFADWVDPNPPGTVEDPEAVDLAAKLAGLKRDERNAKADVAAFEQQRKDVQHALAELVPEGDTVVGPWMVTRQVVRRAPAFNAKLAKAAGFAVHTLDEFMKPGAEYETWRVKPTDEVGAIDFGDVPFE